MPISKKEIAKLSEDIRKIIDGADIDLRDNREGVFSILKNDVHILASMKNEQVNAISKEHELMAENLADISHQLKTPLTSMMIMTDLLEEAPPHKRKEFVANIKKELNHTQWLVSALLKMAKLDAKATEFSLVNVSSKELIDLALEPLQILLEINNQSIEITGEDVFLCDIKWTAEALTNVMKNAIEHSPEGSVIKVNVSSNPICSWIGVTDEGGGISKDGQSISLNAFWELEARKAMG